VKFQFPKTGKIINENHKFQYEVYNDKHPIKIVCAGRFSGKSVLGSCVAIRGALRDELQNVYIISRNYNHVKKVYWRLLKQILFEMKKRDGVQYTTNEHELSITFENGSIIYLFTADKQDNLVGLRMDVVIVDEMASYKSDEFWDIAIYPNLDFELNPNSEILVISTPRGFNSFYRLYEMGTKDDDMYKSFHFESKDSPFVSKDKLEKAKKKNPSLYAQEYEAKFTALGNKTYLDFDRRIHSSVFPIVPNVPISVSMDFNYGFMCWTIGSYVSKQDLLDNGITPPKLINDEGKIIQYDWQDNVFLIHKNLKIENTNLQRALHNLDEYLLQELKFDTNKDLLYIFGDASNNKSILADEKTNWDRVRDYYPFAEIFVPDKNPYQENRTEAVNDKILNSNNEIGLLINIENAEETIKDFEQQKYMDNGKSLDKSKERYGIGHLQDAAGYWITFLSGSELIETECPEFVCM